MMIQLTKPVDDPGSVFDLCISKVRNANLRNQLQSCRPFVVAGTADFEAKVRGQIHTIQARAGLQGLSNSALSAVYTNRMAAKTSPGRAIYDKLRSQGNGRCPLCGWRLVTTLDHYLPKTEYPEFVVNPINLVPACKDCNEIKDSHCPKTAKEEMFHPYYDALGTDQYLSVQLVQTSPVTFVYSIVKPNTWTQLLFDRIQNHFSVLRLGHLFGVHAGEEHSNIKFGLNIIFAASGAQGVKDYLQGEATSRAAHNPNSWQTAFYTAIAADDWFCGGGFNF